MNTKNDYLEFYGKHHISPVKQDITDLELHYRRRKKLYRQCGMPVLAFHNSNLLEIGPGGGINTLAFCQWGCKQVDLVEANPKGLEDMQRLFDEQNISKDTYKIIPCTIENYDTDKKYDIIIAEGFLHFLPNQQMIIDKIKSLLREDGIAVVTCVDNASLYIEVMKRLIGQALAKDISQYDDKAEYLCQIFEPQLAKLKGVSRMPKDWVQDMILNPATSNNIVLDMAQAICYFEQDFDVLGSSPQMFTDYSWYKDVWHDYIADYKQQFEEKRLSLLLSGIPEAVVPGNVSSEMVSHFESIRTLAEEYEKTFQTVDIEGILGHMKEMESHLHMLNQEFRNVFYEIRDALLKILQTGTVLMDDYPHFFSAFGRGQQYMAFVKK